MTGAGRGRVLTCFLLLAVGLAAPAFGEEGRALTLDDAVARALATNPRVLQAQKDVDAARGRRLQLEAVPNPELSFETAALPLWNNKGGEEFSLGVRQLIEFPGKRGLRRQIGRSGEGQAALGLERARNVVRGRVERAYFLAAHARKRLDGLASILETLKAYAELAGERYKSGQVPYLDIIRGRLETLRLQNEIVEARRELKERTAALELLMAVPEYEPLEFLTDLGFAPLGKSLDELKAAALAGSSPRLAAARREQALLSLALAKKSGRPDFTVGLFTPSKRLGGWGFEVGMTLPVFRKGPRGAAIEAEALSGQASLELEARTRRILFTLESAFTDARALEEQIALFRDSLIRDVEESLKAGLINYQYGKSDALGVLDIVRSLKETRAEFLRALLNHRLALIDIATAGEDEDLGSVDGI
ncbi:MAG TPA: TolC family protein [Burkholderiales bacterium]|nr:TolC family protein [Burkholderiales bacterium]